MLGQTDYCYQLYRPESMELWKVKAGSVLCTEKSNSTGYSSNIGIFADPSDLFLFYEGRNNSLKYHWRSAEKRLGGSFGVAVYSPKGASGVILRFSEDQTPGTYNNDWNDGLGAYRRTTYGINKGDIEKVGGSNSSIAFYFYLIVIAVVLVLGVFNGKYPLGSIFLSCLAIEGTILFGYLQIQSTGICILVLLCSLIVPCIVAGTLFKLGNEKNSTFVALFLLLILMGYTFWGGFSIGAWTALFFIIGLSFHCMSSQPNRTESLVQNISVSCFLASTLLSLACLVNYSPALLLMSIKTGLRDYNAATNMEGILWVIVYGAELLVLTIVAIYAHCKLRNTQQMPQGPLDEQINPGDYI